MNTSNTTQTTDATHTKKDSSPSKIKVGLFTFTCCEDSTIMITVLMNDYLLEWKKRIEFVEARVLRKHAPENAQLDVAFVEGAIAAEKQAKKLKSIRKRSKKLIALGSCACTGMPSALRNDFDEKTNKEIEMVLNRFEYADKVQKIADVVDIDGMIPGCPMNTNLFLKTLNDVFEEFGHEPVELKK